MRIKKTKLISAALFLPYILIDNILKQTKKTKKTKKILLIFMGFIGDYILFRNFIEEIKKDPQYKNYSITFCGDPLWKKISEKVDKDYIDKFIWINRKKFLVNLKYRFKKLKEINKEVFEIVLNPNYGRSFSEESIVNVSNSVKKIGNEGSPEAIFCWQKKVSNKYYSKLIFPKNKNNFEFFRNKDFFEQFLKKNLHTKLKITFEKTPQETYATFVPGAGADYKKWSPKNFSKIADFLIKKKNLRIKILGSKKDSSLAKQIISNSKYPEKLEDLTGNKLSDSVGIIGNSILLISNETGPSHIGAATNTLTICPTNGNKFGRFHPYPKEISKKIIHVYPPEFKNKTFNELAKEYSLVSNLSINSVKPSEVIKIINSFLH